MISLPTSGCTDSFTIFRIPLFVELLAEGLRVVEGLEGGEAGCGGSQSFLARFEYEKYCLSPLVLCLHFLLRDV